MAGLCLLLLLAALPFSLVAAYSFRGDDNFLPDSFEVNREEEALTGENCPCDKELSRWDKAFVMLEDSQMRQNMLLQSVDDGLAGELRAVRSELSRLLAWSPGACGRAPEKAKQWEPRHDGLLVRQQENARQLREVLLSVLGALEEKLEEPGPTAPEASSDGLCRALTEELRLTRDELRASRARLPPARHSEMPTEAPPAGCPTALTFPTHPKGTQASVHPTLKRDLLAFTACVWAKPSHGTEKTVLFSYCAGGNGTEFQLSLNQDSVVFSVGRTQHAEAGALTGSFGKWTHYCGIWDGDSGKATLVVDGQAVGSQGQVAWAQVIPGGGAVQLGHESSDCRTDGKADDKSTVFIGKLTGFNLWDVAITEAEVAPLLRSNGCNVKGNVVGWDVAQVTLGGGVLLH